MGRSKKQMTLQTNPLLIDSRLIVSASTEPKMGPSRRRETQDSTVAASQQPTEPQCKKRRTQKSAGATPRTFVPGQRLTLLGLPVQTRKIILEILLKSSTPLWYGPKIYSKLRLSPKILQTCKQLRDEGNPILYSNEVGIGVGYYSTRHQWRYQLAARKTAPRASRWNRERAVPTSVPDAIEIKEWKLRRLSKTFAKVSAHILQRTESIESLRLGVRALVDLVHDHEEWTHLNVVLVDGDRVIDKGEWHRFIADVDDHSQAPGDVENPMKSEDDTDSEADSISLARYPENPPRPYLSSYILQPLFRLGGQGFHITHITCKGVANSTIKELNRRLQMPNPAYELVDMLYALRNDCVKVLQLPQAGDCFATDPNEGLLGDGFEEHGSDDAESENGQSDDAEREENGFREDVTDTASDHRNDSDEADGNPDSDVHDMGSINWTDTGSFVEKRLWNGCRTAAIAEDPMRFFEQRSIVMDMMLLIHACRNLKTIYAYDAGVDDPFRKMIKQECTGERVLELDPRQFANSATFGELKGMMRALIMRPYQ
jgi:hypothetical protein